MTGATLHIFNPDTDFALGYDGDNFTPKANIISLRRRLALLPSLWAAPGDAILLLDAPEKNMLYADKVKEKTLRLVSVEDLDDNDFAAIKPWAGIPPSGACSNAITSALPCSPLPAVWRL